MNNYINDSQNIGETKKKKSICISEIVSLKIVFTGIKNIYQNLVSDK